MALKTRQRLLAEPVKFAKDQTVVFDLPKDNLTRRVSMHIKSVIDMGANVSVGIKNGDILNLIKRIEVRLNGNDNIFDLDLRTYFQALTFQYQASPYKDSFAIPAANGTATDYIEIPIDFALIRNQLLETSALIPAQLLDSFQLLITWGDIDDVVVTVNNGSVDSTTEISLSIVEVYENTPDTSELNNVMNNLTRVYEGVEQTQWNQQYASYPADELPIQIRPTNSRILEHMIIGLNNITDGNPAYDNDVIDRLKIENVKGGGELLFIDKFVNLNRQQILDEGLEADNISGAIRLNWVDRRNGGLENIEVDALKFKLLTETPTANKANAARIYKKFIPVS